MWILWLIAAGVFFVIEIYTVGFFICWFGVGALVALVVSLFTTNLYIQTVAFLVSSCLFLILTKPIVKKFVKTTDKKPTNVYSLIGKEGIVLEDIDTLNFTGKIKVNGELWSAIADENIEKDSKVKVVSINGVKAKVEKV